MPAAYEVTVIIFKHSSLSLLKKQTTHRGKWKKRFLKLASCYCCSVAKSCPTLWPHELQDARLPCPSLSPGVCSNSCPLNWWCHPTVSSSATLFCPQSFPASVSFPVSLLFASGDQNIGSFILSISPSNEYSGLISIRLDWFDLLAVQGTLKSDKKLGEGLSWLGSSSAAVAPDTAGSRTSGSISRSLLLALSWQLFFLLCRLHVRVVSLLSSNSLRPHGLQHARPPCPSPTPRVYSNSYPLSRWCHPTISSSVVPFSSCLQSFLPSESFQVSQFFASGGQSIGVSALASFLLIKKLEERGFFPL